jgi:hypothetical protein
MHNLQTGKLLNRVMGKVPKALLQANLAVGRYSKQDFVFQKKLQM